LVEGEDDPNVSNNETSSNLTSRSSSTAVINFVLINLCVGNNLMSKQQD
jgi:hypothetical protein